MSEKTQFDELLGGNQCLPSEVGILKVAAARGNEIAAMTYSIENPRQTKLVFQKLPMHMRRRIMSHNVRRMPCRLREIHVRQMSKSGLPPKSKRPSRKWRRRPQNLISEYERRQGKIRWLETHVWHAKRFKFSDKWGFKIPSRSYNRCFRSSYRAVAEHTLIQDISYYSCIEIDGQRHSIVKSLNQHCDPNSLSFAAKSFAQGNREGNLMFFEYNGFPRKPIGHVDFIWKPGNGEIRRIWIWAHPSFYRKILAQISLSFGFEIKDSSTVYLSSDGKCRVNLLGNSLNRLRLHGPLSLKVLTDSLRLPQPRNSNVDKEDRLEFMDTGRVELDPKDHSEVIGGPGIMPENEKVQAIKVEGRENESNKSRIPWDVEYYQNYNNAQSFRVQKDIFELLKDLKSPSQLPPRVVMAFTVLDPRYYAPRQRIKANINDSGFEDIPVPPTLANLSPIWDDKIRKSTIKNFKTQNDVNNLRSRNLVPGIENDFEYDENFIDKIPILLVQRPGSTCEKKSIGFSSAIDVILPSRWANAFWISFILRCAKPGGLRESRSIIFENLTLNSADFNPPDTEAYAEDALETKHRLLEKYFRHPPNRRTNYIKLGISSPFYCEWNLLTKEWMGSERFYVLRDERLLKYLAGIISCFDRKEKQPKMTLDQTPFKDIPPDCLITVKISIVHKGCPKDFAIICLPTVQDSERLLWDKNWAGPTAKMIKDANEAERKNLRRGHLALLRRLRRQRVRYMSKLENGRCDMNGQAMVNQLKRKAKSIADAQAAKMKNLYLPRCKTVRYSCDREVMGYVIKGDFSFTESKGVGIGYVPVSAVFKLIECRSDLVLVRNTTTRQYRIARLNILV